VDQIDSYFFPCETTLLYNSISYTKYRSRMLRHQRGKLPSNTGATKHLHEISSRQRYRSSHNMVGYRIQNGTMRWLEQRYY
jgi:hypothetical protein